MIKSNINKRRIFQILSEVKLEQKLIKIFEEAQCDFDVNLLAIVIRCSFETMTAKFKHDCFQHNAHMNYLKPLPVLKQSLNILCNKMDIIIAKYEKNHANPNVTQSINGNHEITGLEQVMHSVSVLLECATELQQQCMIYVEVSFINRFFTEHIFRVLSFQQLVQFTWICLNFIENSNACENEANVEHLTMTCTCLTHILKSLAIFNESNNFFTTEASLNFFDRLLVALYDIVRKYLASKSILEKCELKTILCERSHTDSIDAAAELSYAKAIFLGVFVESCFNKSDSRKKNIISVSKYSNSFKEAVLSLIISTMRSDSFYFFAITPRDIINSFDWQHNSRNKTITFQSVPIDCLNEIEIVEKFLKR